MKIASTRALGIVAPFGLSGASPHAALSAAE